MILGRRVLVAPVDGALGRRIQAWRETHDPPYAAVMGPHLTLCYQPTPAASELIEAQVRHALPGPLNINLSTVGELGNRDCTLCIAITETSELDAARERLFDGRFVQLEGYRTWRWHVTLVRNGRARDRAALVAHAARELRVEGERLEMRTVELLERGPERYEAIGRWLLGA
ncbi:MAG: 2'-5' RNA ligase family protein [Chloroflexi bacterium]|nr:2'-5' RNA ligase family protein [Chloroflexota bacterium]